MDLPVVPVVQVFSHSSLESFLIIWQHVLYASGLSVWVRQAPFFARVFALSTHGIPIYAGTHYKIVLANTVMQAPSKMIHIF